MDRNYMYGRHTNVKRKRTIITTVAIIALLTGAVAGATLFFKGDDTTQAVTNTREETAKDNIQDIQNPDTITNDSDLQEIIEEIIEDTEISTSSEEQNEESAMQPAIQTDNDVAVNEEGNNPFAEEQSNPVEQDDNTQFDNDSRTTELNRASINNMQPEEFITYREVIASEDFLVGWAPISISTVLADADRGIYKPELEITKNSYTESDLIYNSDGSIEVPEKSKYNTASDGELIVYEIGIKNVSNIDASNIKVSATIPENSIFAGAEDGYKEENGVITWVVNIPKNSEKKLRVSALVDDSGAGTITNTVIVDGSETNETYNPIFVAENNATIYRDGEEVSEPVNQGDKIEYRVTIANNGNAAGTTFVKNAIPENTKLVSNIEIDGQVVDYDEMNEGMDVTIEAGQTANITYMVEAEKIDGEITNEPTVGRKTIDKKLKTANLELSKTISTSANGDYSQDATLKANETAYFKIDLKNTGSETLDLTLTDLMNDVKLDLYDGEKKIEDKVSLASRESKVLTTTYKITQEDIDRQEIIKSTITANSSKISEMTRTAKIIPEGAHPHLAVKKTTETITESETNTTKEVKGGTSARVNDIVKYSILVKNDGNITLKDVEIIDTLDIENDGKQTPANSPFETIERLLPNEEKTYTVKYVVTQEDIDNDDPIKNSVIVTDGEVRNEAQADKEVMLNRDIKISGTKTWIDYNNGENTRPDKIVVNIVNGKEVVDTIETTKEDNWKFTSKALPKYDENYNEINYTATENTDGYTTAIAVIARDDIGNRIVNITNTLNADITTNVSGTKTWIDYDNGENTRPENITIKVMNDKTVVDTQTIGSESNWSFKSKSLPKYDNKTDGNVINYTVEEIEVPGYTTKMGDIDIKENGDRIINITNTLDKNATVTVSGTKTWIDYKNGEDTRPESIKIKLTNGTNLIEGKVETLTEEETTYSFTNLPKYDSKESGNIINYNIIEEATGKNGAKYNQDIKAPIIDSEGNRVINVVNTLDGEKTITVSGTKTWADYENKENTRPDGIVVKIMNGETTIETIPVMPDNNNKWAYKSKSLPKYDSKANGNIINYTVTELETDGYTATIERPLTADNGDITVNIVNTLDRDVTVTVSGTKTWIDYKNQENTRPDSITIKVMNGKTLAEKITVTPDSNEEWKYESNPLPKYVSKTDGTINVYTVEEEVTGKNGATYTKDVKSAVVDSQGNSVINITNTLENDVTITVSGTNTWLDYKNKEHTRPDSIKTILTDGTNAIQGKEQTVRGSSWEYSFTDLPKYDSKEDGNLIAYNITEQVKGKSGSKYTCDIKTPIIEESGNRVINVTNTLEGNRTILVSGNINWSDKNNQGGTRPRTVTVKIMNGTTVVDTLTVIPDAGGRWTYLSKYLTKYVSKETDTLVNYVAEEVVPNGYTAAASATEITDIGNRIINITNTLLQANFTVDLTSNYGKEATVEAESNVTYTIKVTNNGNKTGSITIKDTALNSLMATPNAKLTMIEDKVAITNDYGVANKTDTITNLKDSGKGITLNDIPENKSATLTFTLKISGEVNDKIDNKVDETDGYVKLTIGGTE